MKYSQRRNIILFMVVVAVVVCVVRATTTKRYLRHHHDIYYCPMHPNYTSDKPGDCPICTMKLVKKETPTSAQSRPEHNQKKRDICYLHKCPMVLDGKPCPLLVVAKQGEKVICPICGTHISEEVNAVKPKERKILYWTDPMIPGYKSDKPGKSPMGMDLVPVYDEGEGSSVSSDLPEGYATILVTPQKQQLIGIKTAKVEKKKLIKTVRTVGTIAHDPELYQAQTEYIQAIQAYQRSQEGSIPEIIDQAKRLVESTRIRLKHFGLSDEMIDDIATWKEAEHSLLFAHPGDPVWMYAQIYEYELPLVKVGQSVDVQVPALSNEHFMGTVKAIDAMVDAATRTIRLRARIEDPQGHLKPDMYVNVIISIDLGESLAIPEEAVFNTGTKMIVFVDKGQGLFDPRDVSLGAKTEDGYQVKEGIKEGEVVVTNGNFLIDSESRLKSALEGFSQSSSNTQENKRVPEHVH